jgi:hypothetical protein
MTPLARKSHSAINFLVNIFKDKAHQEILDIDIQRGERQEALSQRVLSEGNEVTSDEPSERVPTDVALQRVTNNAAPLKTEVRLTPDLVEANQLQNTTNLEVFYPSNSNMYNGGLVISSKDEDVPSTNTRTAKCKQLLCVSETKGSCTSTRQVASRRYPLQFLADFAGVVLDDKSGEMTECRHLIRHPKYKKDWGYLFDNEIGRLAQGMLVRNTVTNTIFFVDKSEVPGERRKDVAYTIGWCATFTNKRRK